MEPAPFRFRLERVRALRERAEDSAKQDLAVRITHLVHGETALRAAGERLEQARGASRRLGSEAVCIGDLIAAQAYLERTQSARDAAAMDLVLRDADVDAARDALVAATTDRQVLERLRERQLEAHRLQALRSESVVLDDVTAARHAREAAR